MKEVGTGKKLYNRICEAFSIRNMSWMALAIFVFLLLPIFYLSFVNRASGDDYGYGTYTRAAWVASHSLIEVAKAIGRTIRQYYYGWQGTWFSIAVFSLQPEVFNDGAYVIVVFLMLFLWIGSTALLSHQILCKECGFDRWNFLLLTTIYMMINIQFVPSTKSAIFWFNGCAHYMLPFAMCQFMFWCLLKFVKEYKIRYLVGITVLATLLGGSNYQAALLAIILMVYMGIVGWVEKRDKRIFLLLISFVLEAIGLVISMKAPGNKVRGGEEFGLSVGKGIKTIGMSFSEGIMKICDYAKEKPLVFVGLLLFFLFCLEAFKSKKEVKKLQHPVVVALALFCMYCAMRAPEIYAGVDVSGGVHNTNYMVFLFMAAGILLIISNQLAGSLKLTSGAVHQYIVLPGIMMALLLIVLGRGGLKGTTSWKCLDYIRSGQSADYKWQMDLQTKILTDEGATDAILPFINDEQGPLMQMPVTNDPEAWTNTVTREFYGKNSVVAIPRAEWEDTYGNE